MGEQQLVRDDIDLMDGHWYARQPYELWKWMRENAPVYWDDHARLWGISLYDDVMAVSKDPATFSNAGGTRPDAPAMPDMINVDDPLHKKRRNLVNKGFTVRRVGEMEGRVREICVGAIERAKRKQRFDFVHDLAAWVPLIVIGDMLGAEPEVVARILHVGAREPAAVLVEQRADATDGRAMLINATRQGQRLCTRIASDLVQQQKQLLGDLAPEIRAGVVQVDVGQPSEAGPRLTGGPHDDDLLVEVDLLEVAVDSRLFGRALALGQVAGRVVGPGPFGRRAVEGDLNDRERRQRRS